MTKNKNQHFVPKTHFKPFSIGGEGRVIHLLNLNRMRPIFGVPLKSQCSQDYFYGHDARLETAIQMVEGSYGKCVSSLHDSGAFIESMHVVILRRFAYLQYLRTEAAARVSAESAFAMTSIKGSDIEQPTFKRAIQDGVILAMRHYAKTMNIVDDLQLLIVRNHTSIPFITSDDPAVLLNMWHQKNQHAKNRSFGVGSAGMILILPLSPTLLAVMLDRDTYKCEHRAGWIRVINPADIVACNDQQILNCAANLYFSERSAEAYLKSRTEAIMHLRPQSRVKASMAVPDGGTDTHIRYKVLNDPDLREHGEVLTHVRTIRPVAPNWPSFLKFRIRRFVYTNDTGAGFRRLMTAFSESPDSPPWRRIKG